jgi:FMN phosphatase YigB (HAD superfamily)
MTHDKKQLLRKVIRHWRSYGARATLKRAFTEALNRVRRRLAGPRPLSIEPAGAALLARIREPAVKLVIFDIFDTLVTRPLLDPEHAKQWVAQHLRAPDYPARRQAAEISARERLGREVDLPDICAEYVRLYGAADGEAAGLQAAEEAVELALVHPLAGMVEVLNTARAMGKRVVLASDMFLSEVVIRRILSNCGITCDALYLSSALGKRKSTSALYSHICVAEHVSPAQILMIGDHPQSDQAIPARLGLQVAPAISPVQRLASFPRLSAWAAKVQASTDPADELVLGQCVRRFFDPPAGEATAYDQAALTQRGRYGIGYSIVGPLLVAFTQWLVARAKADGIERLYFLAREGQAMKAIHDVLMAGRPGPTAHYLVLSRRAISVPMIQSREDILAIARTDYQANALTEFLWRRYGLRLDGEALADLDRQGLWQADRLVEVQAGCLDDALVAVLDHLAPAIYDRVTVERGPMLAYLDRAGLASGAAALVDVGYAGTIQGRLCELTGAAVHGYYMITRAAAGQIRSRHGVRTAGCFGNDLDTPDQSPLLRYNVPLEMLMGADEPQIAHYRQAEDGSIVPVYGDLSADEIAANPLRGELRAGALDFARDWRRLLDAGLDVPHLSPTLAADLFRDFWEGISAAERAQIAAIATDDHYCGMGIVHFATFMPH